MRRLLVLFAFALVAAGSLPALAQTSSPQTQQVQYSPAPPPYGRPGFDDRRGRRDGLRILSAWYGIENRACDAERAVERICGGRSECTVPVTNRLCGDPAPYVVKVLTVHYACRGRERSITRWEGRHMGLRCDPRPPRY